MINDIHLAIFINEYDKKPIYMDLMEFKDVNELDYFMNYFDNDNNKVRKQFDQEIFEYLLDNVKQLKKVEEKTKKKFYGRISAYYFDDVHNMHFLKLSTPNKIIVRDYHNIPDEKECISFLFKVFDKAEKTIFDRFKKINYNLTEKNFIYLMERALDAYGYKISDNEKKYLAKYYNYRTDKNRQDVFNLIKVNVKNFYNRKKMNNEVFESFIPNKEELNLVHDALEREEELVCLYGASDILQHDLEMFKKTGDYEYLFGNHDIEEINQYTNYYDMKKKGKK